MYKNFSRFLLILSLLFAVVGFAQDSTPPMVQDAPSSQEVPSFETPAEAPVTYQGAFVKMMLTLIALIVLIVLSVWMLRRISHGRMQQLNSGRAIKILERRPLSAKSVLYIIEISGKKVLIAESQLEVRRITSLDDFSKIEE